jgi:hypothetical protein
MSKLEVNAVEPQCGTNLTLGASGDTIIIPSGATISNQGTAAGFGPTGAVSWNTTKITADPNPAVTGVGYFADTTSAAFTITLPSSPSAGAVVGIADYANTFATNNITVGRNGSNIGGSAINAVLSTNGVSVTLVYVDATQGWIVTDSGNRSDLPLPTYIVATGGTITCDGDFKVHTFTGPGTFTVSSVGNPLGSTTVDYLVLAGGGGGGDGISAAGAGGGGGAGGYRNNFPSPAIAGSPVTATGYPITVGAGGASNNSGSPSIFSTITSTGGGRGGYQPANSAGAPGGSGGGGRGCSAAGGTGNSPPTSPSQGNNGGTGSGTGTASGSGGGGAGAVGSNALPPSPEPGPGQIAGNGGVGSPNSISGSAVFYAGGGGGGSNDTYPGKSSPGGAGGNGGGGAGGDVTSFPGPTSPKTPGIAGTANTGGGGGGGAQFSSGTPGAAGGSGIVVIRYKFQ